MDDSQAVNAVLAGDKQRYEELVRRYQRMVYAIAWSQLGDPDLSEDVAQETFVKAYCYLGTLREPSRFSSWLARIARNICGSFRRKAKREDAFRRRWAVLEAAEPNEPEESRESLTEQIWSSFAELPPIHREALTIFYIQGKSAEDMAVLLGISEAAARTRLHRARTALRQQLASRLEDALGELHPSGKFTSCVMALLPLSPKGVGLGTGGLIAVAGKFSAGLTLVLWFFLAPLAVLITSIKLELANIVDAPQNLFRRRVALRTPLLILLVGVVTGLLSVVALRFFVGHMGAGTAFAMYSRIMLILLLPPVYLALRALRVSRSVDTILTAASSIIFILVYAAVGFFNASGHLASYMMLAMMIVFAAAGFAGKLTSNRYDYSIFIRCATGGVAEVPEQKLPLPRRISDLQFVSFARFLGEERLIWDYSLGSDNVILKPNPPLSGSSITVTRSGECEAVIGSRSLRSLSKTVGSQVDKQEIERKASSVVCAALAKFLDGNIEGAKSVITAQSNESILRTPTHKSAGWRLLVVFTIVFWLWLLFGPMSHHAK